MFWRKKDEPLTREDVVRPKLSKEQSKEVDRTWKRFLKHVKEQQRIEEKQRKKRKKV